MTSAPTIRPHSSKPFGDEDGRGVLVTPVDELEEERGPVLSDGEVADLVDHQRCRVGEGLEALVEVAGGAGLLKEVDESGPMVRAGASLPSASALAVPVARGYAVLTELPRT